MTVEITLDNVLPMLKQAVDTRGRDYRYHDDYDECRYTVDYVNPACLIGVLIAQQSDNPADTLSAAANYTDATELFGYAGSRIPDPAATTDPNQYLNMDFMAIERRSIDGFKVSRDAAIVLKAAQNAQDDTWSSRTWGEAYDTAEAVHQLLVAKRDSS